MKTVRITAKTVDEAVAEGLRKLGATREEAVVRVIEEPTGGLFGLLRKKPAVVEISVPDLAGSTDIAKEAARVVSEAFHDVEEPKKDEVHQKEEPVQADFPKEEQKRHESPAALQALFINGTSFSAKGGGSVQDHPEKVKAANPVTYISPKTPPFLLMHGDKDQVVSPSQTELLYQALQEKGIPATRYVVEDAGHSDQYWAQPEVEQVILAFLNQNLKSKQ